MQSVIRGWLAALLVLAVAMPVAAQSAEDRRAAGNAYNRGSAAYLAERWAEAARWFETAHRLAPAAPALVQAVRAHALAGHDLRAATLSLRLEATYPDDEAAAATAAEVLGERTSQFVRIDVICDDCSVELDGTLQEHPSFFVSAGEEHRVDASFPTGSVAETVSGQAGETRELTFDAPPPTDDPTDITEGPPADDRSRDREPRQDGSSGGLSPVFFISGAVLTAGAGAVLIWSGLDALAGVGPYEDDPTDARLTDGQARELRTNIMIGVTAGLAAITTVLLIFTDWGGADEERLDVAAFPVEGGAAASLGGRF
jgi:hypothetical protein